MVSKRLRTSSGPWAGNNGMHNRTALAVSCRSRADPAGGHGHPDFASAEVSRRCVRERSKTGWKTPLSPPSESRLPNTASASSSTTITGAERAHRHQDPHLLAFVCRPIFERNSPISITGRPHSLAKQSMRKDLPTRRDGDKDAGSRTSFLAVFDEPSQFAEFLLAASVRGDVSRD